VSESDVRGSGEARVGDVLVVVDGVSDGDGRRQGVEVVRVGRQAAARRIIDGNPRRYSRSWTRSCRQ